MFVDGRPQCLVDCDNPACATLIRRLRSDTQRTVDRELPVPLTAEAHVQLTAKSHLRIALIGIGFKRQIAPPARGLPAGAQLKPERAGSVAPWHDPETWSSHVISDRSAERVACRLVKRVASKYKPHCADHKLRCGGKPMRVLVTWIGHTDLRAMAVDQPSKVQKEIGELVGGDLKAQPGSKGPVRTLLEAESFDHIHLLSTYPEAISKRFVKWIGEKASLHLTKLENPTDYGAIFATVDEVMKRIVQKLEGVTYDLSILLSPGTPAMAAIWVLLGKTKYPARFYQTWDTKAWVSDIPFDLTVDVVPELLRDPDSHFQHLASLSPHEVQGFEKIIGDGKAIRLAVGRAKKAAMRDVPVLLSGESGTGKEMFARAICAASHRRDKPFKPINCAAIPKRLMESELFGHEQGAFTGADKKYEGAFQRADGGTLFLDEVGELAPDIQAKLLRILQPPPDSPPCTREFTPLGATDSIRTDVRVVAATNRNLLSMVQAGEFREDLFYRLAVITIKLPALRDRRSDAARIAANLLAQINRDFERQEPGYRHKSLSASAKAFVSKHAWPGNVRELYNALLQAAVMSNQDEIEVDDIKVAITEMPTGKTLKDDPLELPLGDSFNLEQHLETMQRHYLRRAMREANGVKTQAARLLGMKNYQTLDAQLKRLEVDV